MWGRIWGYGCVLGVREGSGDIASHGRFLGALNAKLMGLVFSEEFWAGFWFVIWVRFVADYLRTWEYVFYELCRVTVFLRCVFEELLFAGR